MMFLFTDYIPSPEERYEFGKYFLYLLYFDLAINLIVLALEISKMIKRNCKRCILHRKLRKERKLKI